MSNNSSTENPISGKSMMDCVVRWIKKRYGLLLLATLLLWPVLGLVPLCESIVVNGLLLETYWQLAYLSITNVIAFFFAISVLRVLGSRNPGGWVSRTLFGDGEAPWGTKRVLVVALVSTFTPLFLALVFGSEFPGTQLRHIGLSFLTVSASVVIGVAGLWALGFFKCLIFGSQKESANYFPFEAITAKGFWFFPTSLEKLEKLVSRFGLSNIDLQFTVYLLLLATAHRMIARNLENEQYWLTSAPSMLVALLWLALMTLAGLANSLDRWRIPPLLVFVLLLTALMILNGSTKPLNTFSDVSKNQFSSRVLTVQKLESAQLDSQTDLEQRRQLIAKKSKPLEEDAWLAISDRMKQLEAPQNNKGKTVVVVTCPGGGIHAAAWASCVLDQLSEEYVEFKDSVCVISGVSGGSVATLMFVGSRYEDELLMTMKVGSYRPTTEEVHQELKDKSPALELSARSALEAIAVGATVDDLYGLVGFPGPGRGQRLEDDLNSRLHNDIQKMTMGEWGDRALAGKIPIVIFNSTDAVTGRRILFDTIPTPSRASSVGLTARPFNYREIIGTPTKPFDILPATAARTSATFPYISPFTKPSNANAFGENVAICDGGYVDNEGIVTAVNWIEFLLKRWVEKSPNERPFDRILLLRIEPSSVEDNNRPADSGGLSGAFRWIAGPGEAMAKVRSTSQLERGNLETDLAALYLEVPSSTKSPPKRIRRPRVGMQVGDAPMLQQSSAEIPEFDKRKLDKAVVRQNWEKMLDKYEKNGEVPAYSQSGPPVQATVQVEETTPTQASTQPVVVQSIKFIDAYQSIPLNWKLSNRQKQGYLLAWNLCSASGTELRKTMDQYFTRRDDSNQE